MKFLRVCAEPGCPELTMVGRCEKHKRERAASVRARSLDWNWVYATPRWKGLRKQVILEQPWCLVEGCFELSAEVDHVVSMQDGGAPFDRANLAGMCKPHHSAKTREEMNARKGVAS